MLMITILWIAGLDLLTIPQTLAVDICDGQQFGYKAVDPHDPQAYFICLGLIGHIRNICATGFRFNGELQQCIAEHQNEHRNVFNINQNITMERPIIFNIFDLLWIKPKTHELPSTTTKTSRVPLQLSTKNQSTASQLDDLQPSLGSQLIDNIIAQKFSEIENLNFKIISNTGDLTEVNPISFSETHNSNSESFEPTQSNLAEANAYTTDSSYSDVTSQSSTDIDNSNSETPSETSALTQSNSTETNELNNDTSSTTELTPKGCTETDNPNSETTSVSSESIQSDSTEAAETDSSETSSVSSEPTQSDSTETNELTTDTSSTTELTSKGSTETDNPSSETTSVSSEPTQSDSTEAAETDSSQTTSESSEPTRSDSTETNELTTDTSSTTELTSKGSTETDNPSSETTSVSSEPTQSDSTETNELNTDTSSTTELTSNGSTETDNPNSETTSASSESIQSDSTEAAETDSSQTTSESSEPTRSDSTETNELTTDTSSTTELTSKGSTETDNPSSETTSVSSEPTQSDSTEAAETDSSQTTSESSEPTRSDSTETNELTTDTSSSTELISQGSTETDNSNSKTTSSYTSESSGPTRRVSTEVELVAGSTQSSCTEQEEQSTITSSIAEHNPSKKSAEIDNVKRELEDGIILKDTKPLKNLKYESNIVDHIDNGYLSKILDSRTESKAEDTLKMNKSKPNQLFGEMKPSKHISKSLLSHGKSSNQAVVKETTECTYRMNGAYIRDTELCNKFYICANGRAIPKKCPGNLHFDIEKMVCNYPSLVDCSPKILQVISLKPFLAPAVNSEDNFALKQASGPDCSCLPNWAYIRDSNQCSKFYVCINSRAIPRQCPRGLNFDVHSKYCNFPSLVDCSNGKGQKSTIATRPAFSKHLSVDKSDCTNPLV